MKIRKGDKVIVITGKDKGKQGTVAKALPSKNKVVIDGVNIKKVHQKPRGGEEAKGEIIEKSFPIDVSNVMFVDAKTGKPTRVGYKMEKGKKVRVAKKSGAVIS